MEDNLKSRYEWMDEAFERGYQLGLVHGSKGSGLTWVMADKAKPDDESDIAIAVPLSKRQAKKIAKHPEEYVRPYGLAFGQYFSEDTANEYFGRAGFSLPDLVVVGKRDMWAWEDVIAWAYLNAPNIGAEKKGE